MPKNSEESSELDRKEKETRDRYRTAIAPAIDTPQDNPLVEFDPKYLLTISSDPLCLTSRMLMFSDDMRNLPRECDVSKHSSAKRRNILHNWKFTEPSIISKMHFAARWGFVAYIDRLLKENDIDINTTGVLYEAALNQEFEMLVHLVEQHKANVNYRHKEPHMGTALLGAIQSGDIKSVNYLIEKGASVDDEGALSERPIECCLANLIMRNKEIDKKYIPILQALISAGAPLLVELKRTNTSITEHISVLPQDDDRSIDDVEAAVSALSLDIPDAELTTIVPSSIAASSSEVSATSTRRTLRR